VKKAVQRILKQPYARCDLRLCIVWHPPQPLGQRRTATHPCGLSRTSILLCPPTLHDCIFYSTASRHQGLTDPPHSSRGSCTLFLPLLSLRSLYARSFSRPGVKLRARRQERLSAYTHLNITVETGLTRMVKMAGRRRMAAQTQHRKRSAMLTPCIGLRVLFKFSNCFFRSITVRTNRMILDIRRIVQPRGTQYPQGLGQRFFEADQVPMILTHHMLLPRTCRYIKKPLGQIEKAFQGCCDMTGVHGTEDCRWRNASPACKLTEMIFFAQNDLSGAGSGHLPPDICVLIRAWAFQRVARPVIGHAAGRDEGLPIACTMHREHRVQRRTGTEFGVRGGFRINTADDHRTAPRPCYNFEKLSPSLWFGTINHELATHSAEVPSRW